MLVAVIFMLALLMLSLAVAAPKVARDIQRDRELETMQRGKQYIRAIRLYYRKFPGTYPPSVDALVKTQNLRFLRKKYVDPTTGKEEWKPIHFGQNKAPTAMGFFGQPLLGSTLAGMGPGGVAGASNPGSAFMGSGGTSGSNGSFGSNNSFGSNGASGSGSMFGTNNSNSNPGTNGTPPSTDASGGNGTGGTGSSTDSGNNLGGNGQTFGGLGIIGFSPNSPKESILVYKTKSHYNEWEFVYDPVIERMMQGGNLGGMGTPASNLNGSPGGTGQSPQGGPGGIVNQPPPNPNP
jgi:type II secretory pathway pseudopilin PulG